MNPELEAAEIRAEAIRQLNKLFAPDPTELSSGAEIPQGQSKILLMVAEQDARDKQLRKALLRKIHNRECAETGDFCRMDFGDDYAQ